MSLNDIYPRKDDKTTIYLKNVITKQDIIVGDYTIYNDFERNPEDFEKNNVLYHYPINNEKLIIGKFCSIACGVKFLFNSANHTSLPITISPLLSQPDATSFLFMFHSSNKSAKGYVESDFNV